MRHEKAFARERERARHGRRLGVGRRPARAHAGEGAGLRCADAYNWTGFYLGLNGGYGFGRSEFNGTLPSGSFDAGGGLFGGTVGYNWQTGPLVFGLEGDIDWSGMRGSGACGGFTCSTRND